MKLLIFLFFYCSIMRHVAAQTAPITPNQTANPTSSSPTTAPTNTPSPSNPINTVLDTVTTIKPGKYEEFNSICRKNEYDVPVFQEKKEQERKLSELNEAIKKTLTNSQLKIHYLKELVLQKKQTEVEKYFEQLKADSIKEIHLKQATAWVYVLKNEFKKAESMLVKLSQENPKDTTTLQYLAEIYLLNSNYFEAASAYIDLEKLTNKKFNSQLCEIYTLDSQYAEADRFCKNASKTEPNNPYAEIYLGIIHREKENYVEALNRFKQSLKIKPTEMAYACIAELYEMKSNHNVSEDLFKKALKIQPESNRSLIGLAWSQLKNKKYSDSIANFKAACIKNRNYVLEVRRAYKYLVENKIDAAKSFSDLTIRCND